MSQRLRIGVVTPVFPNSAEKYRGNYNYSILKSLQRHADVQVFCPLSRAPNWDFLKPRSMRYNPVDFNYDPGGVPVKYLGYPSLPIVSRPINGLVSARRVRPLLKRYRPDLILAYWIYPEGYGALRVARSMGLPLVMGCLGSDLRRVSDPLSNYLIKYTLQRSHAVITVSEEMRLQSIGYGVSPERAHTIINGCDTSTFHPASREAARRRLGIAPETELITFVGWLSPTKGLQELVDAVSRLKATRPNISLACIGEGPMEQQIRSLAAQPGNGETYRLLGARTSAEISECMAASNLFSLPSYSEGCPNVVLEALACGRPVVATNIGGIPEILPRECGMLVPPRDVAALEGALATTLDREWDEEGIARLHSRTWDAVADETYEICTEAYTQFVRSKAVNGHGRRRRRGVEAPGLNLGKDERPRVTVVTPIFPTSAEPYRGWPVFKTIEALRDFASIRVIVPVCQFPRVQMLQPRSMRYNEVDLGYRPSDMNVTYVGYHSLPLVGRPLNGRHSAQRIRAKLIESNPDLVLAYWIYPEGYGAMLMAQELGLPFIIGSRGSDMHLRDPLSRRMSIRVLREADCVLTVSEDLRRRAIATGARPDRVRAILNGIDGSIFRFADRGEARRELGVSPETKLVVFIGWLSRTKGLDTLLDAMARLAARNLPVQVAVIGEGPLADELRQRNQAGPLAGRIRALGPCDRPRIARWLTASNILSLPSVAEGCPNVLIEAFACGRAVVASDVGGIPEIVNSGNGLLLPERSVEALEQALESALFEKTWDEAEIARYWARSWRDVAAETYDACVEAAISRHKLSPNARRKGVELPPANPRLKYHNPLTVKAAATDHTS